MPIHIKSINQHLTEKELKHFQLLMGDYALKRFKVSQKLELLLHLRKRSEISVNDLVYIINPIDLN